MAWVNVLTAVVVGNPKRREIAERAVEPLDILVLTEIFDHDPGLGEGPELLAVEAFFAEAGVERFHKAVLPRARRGDIEGLDILLCEPALSSLAMNSVRLSERMNSGTPKFLHLIAADLISFPTQLHRDPAKTVARILAQQFVQLYDQPGALARRRSHPIMETRACQSQAPARRPPEAQLACHHEGGHHSFVFRAYYFLRSPPPICGFLAASPRASSLAPRSPVLVPSSA